MRFPKLLLMVLAGCATVPSGPLQPIPDAWLRQSAAAVPELRKTYPRSAIRIVPAGGGERLANGDLMLTPAYRDIESFQLSEERKEVVFSAKREGNFDIGLVSADGSPVHWVPEDPADEIAVQWAPRGHKISFTVRAKGGDLVRTVHVPTAFQKTVDFPYALVRDLAWEGEAERYHVLLESPDASARIESVGYGGENRHVEIPPAVQLDVTIEPLGADALLLRPNAIRYNERLPLVIWLDENRLAWNDARAKLMQDARVALVIATKPPDDALFKDFTYIDTTRTFVVGNRQPASGNRTITPGDVPAGRYRTDGNTVIVPAAVVESFAAGYIAEQLKGNPPPNGSHHHR